MLLNLAVVQETKLDAKALDEYEHLVGRDKKALYSLKFLELKNNEEKTG